MLGAYFNATNSTPFADLAYASARLAAIGGQNGTQVWLAAQWANRELNFDHFGKALQALFVVTTLDDWNAVMFDAIDAPSEYGQAPTLDGRRASNDWTSTVPLGTAQPTESHRRDPGVWLGVCRIGSARMGARDARCAHL